MDLSYLQTKTEGAIFEAFDKFLADGGVTEKVLGYLRTRVPPVLSAKSESEDESSLDAKIDEIAGDLLKGRFDEDKKDEDYLADNLFTLTMKEEYSQVNPDFSELIDMLYLRKKYMSADDYKHLNETVYNLVMDTYNRNKVRHVGIYREIMEGKSSQPVTWAKISDANGSMDYGFFYFYNQDFLRINSPELYTTKPLYVTLPEHAYYLNSMNSNKSLYQTSTYVGDFTDTVTSWIKEYNTTVEDEQDKIDEEMMSQLARVTSESDSLNLKELPKQTSLFTDEIFELISPLHKHICLSWVNETVWYYYVPVKDSYNRYNFSVENADELAVLEDDSLSPLYEEFLSKYFKKETALEDLLRIMAFSCPDWRSKETAGTKVRDIEVCLANGKGRAEDIEWMINVLTTPMMESSIGKGTTTLAPVDGENIRTGCVAARTTAAASRGKQVLAKSLPSLAAIASGETLALELGALGVKEILEFIKQHPVYKFIKKHANDNAADVVFLEPPVQSYQTISLPKYLSNLYEKELHPIFLRVMKFYIQLSRFTAALTAVFSVIANKLMAGESRGTTEIVYGLSSSLIHTVYHLSERNHVAMPLDWLADIYKKVISYAPPETIYSLEEQVDRFTQCLDFFDKKENKGHKQMLLLQDKPSPIITSHAPVACLDIEAAERLQQFFAALRAGLKEDYYIIANSMPIPHNELRACLKGENKMSFIPNSIKTDKIARALNRKLLRANWTLDYDTERNQGYYNRPDFYDSETAESLPLVYEGYDPYSIGAYSYMVPDSMRGNFLVEDCPIISGVRLLQLDRYTYDAYTYTRWINNVYNALETAANKYKERYIKIMDSGIAYGHGEVVSKARFNTVWHMKLLNAIAKTPRPDTAKIYGKVVIPEISSNYNLDAPIKQNTVTSNAAINGIACCRVRVEYYKYIKAEKCSISDLLKPAYGSMTIVSKTPFDLRHLDRVAVSRLNWKQVYCYRNRHSGRSAWSQEGRDFIRSSEDGSGESSYRYSLAEFSETNMASVYRSFMPLAYTNNINEEFICFSSIWDGVKEEVRATEYISLHDKLFPMKEFLDGAASIPDQIEEEIKLENSAKIPMDYQLGKNEKSFNLDRTDGKAALELINAYNNFVVQNYKDGKLKKAQEELTKCQLEVELWQEKIFQAKEKITEIEEEIEEVKQKGSAARLDDPLSMQSQLNRLIQEGQILDYTVGSDAKQVIFITKPINIWVSGYIYTLSSAMIKMPLDISQFRLNQDGRVNVYALKDLTSMRAEAFALFGVKYGIKSYLDFNRNLRFVDLSYMGADEGEARDFPHVASGSGCLGYGVAASRIKNAIAQGDLSSFLSGMLMYLNSVNISDSWGRTIRYWPYVPATMFNLIKCGLLTDMDLDRHQMILVPGKYLSYQADDRASNWYSYMTKNGEHKLGAAYVRIYDMDSNILRYLYDEARYLIDKGYDNDFDYIKSFDQANSDYAAFAGGFEAISTRGFFSAAGLQEMVSPAKEKARTELVKSGNVLMEYAYNILTSESKAVQERCWDFLERSILDIRKWRENIRVTERGISVPSSNFKICLEGNTVVIKGE